MRISDWSSDVCSSDLGARPLLHGRARPRLGHPGDAEGGAGLRHRLHLVAELGERRRRLCLACGPGMPAVAETGAPGRTEGLPAGAIVVRVLVLARSEKSLDGKHFVTACSHRGT